MLGKRKSLSIRPRSLKGFRFGVFRIGFRVEQLISSVPRLTPYFFFVIQGLRNVSNSISRERCSAAAAVTSVKPRLHVRSMQLVLSSIRLMFCYTAYTQDRNTNRSALRSMLRLRRCGGGSGRQAVVEQGHE